MSARHTMHSSGIRGTDFRITLHGETIEHRELFSSVRETDRLGVVIPDRLEGIGAATLIMSYVTAFYDRYRERGREFFAYPDFFTFQRGRPCADYCMFDIWPSYKNVHVPPDTQQTAEAIVARGVNVLLVPDDNVHDGAIAPPELESLGRSVNRCYAYTGTGTTESSDLAIECRSDLLRDHVISVLDSLPADDGMGELRERWQARMATATLSQTFRELDFGEALRRI